MLALQIDFEEGDEIRNLPCKHIFHVPCIDEWLRRNTVCGYPSLESVWSARLIVRSPTSCVQCANATSTSTSSR